MKAAIVICVFQMVVVIAYLILSTLQPATAQHIAAVGCFLASFAISRYSLYRVKKKIRQRNGIQG